MTRQLLLLRAVYLIALTWTTLTNALTPVTIAGVRCLVAPYTTSVTRSKNDLDATSKSQSSQPQLLPPPLIIIPGMAQSLSMYEAHASSLSRTRSCLVVEPVGLGISIATTTQQANSSRDVTNVSLPEQAEAVMACAQTAFPEATSFAVAGFSLGGRIGMATACLYPEQIQSLHLTGVASEQSASGRIALTAWKDLLQRDNLRGFAWSALTTTYSAPFLLRNQDRLVDWIDTLVSSQRVDGLLAILEQTHPLETSDPWSVPSMAERLRALDIRGSLCIGVDDRIVSVEACQQLAEALQWAEPVVVQDAGHAVPMEAPRVWRQHLLDSLDDAVVTTKA
jgi:pimeloyl-ACP methyl ester carboxylesterase